jgi:protocatechuate 3,4-dioxygenase alpha subunit
MITPSQTVGPFFAPALLRDRLDVIAGGGRQLSGRVVDGDGAAVADALIEFWCADALSFARVGTDDDGRYAIETSPVPYLSVTLFARGLLNHLSTRVYFEPDASDPVLARVPATRRGSLIARALGAGPPAGVANYEWNIVLQGDPADETVFLAWQR